MALENEAWFIHAVSDNVTQLAQQKQSMVRGALRTHEGVTGKTYPFQRLGAVSMAASTRDDAITFLNPSQTKRRAVLSDRRAAVLIDDFDKVKELANPQSEFAQMLVKARERELDVLTLSVDPASVGGIIGLATTVDEAAETSGTIALSAESTTYGTTVIADGSTGLTMAKILDTKEAFDTNNVDMDDRYFFYSPRAMRKLLTDTQVTSSDYSTINALSSGGFPQDGVWCGFKWRMSTALPLAGDIRSCIAVQKMCVGLAIGLVTEIDVHRNPNYWNNVQAIVKLSAGACRIDPAGVMQVDIDESV